LNAPLIFLAIDVAAIVCAALLIARVLTAQPRLLSARLIALIAFGTACGVMLGRQEYGYWTPPAFRFDVGRWEGALNLARNLTPGAIMALCHTLFTDRQRFPRWLLVLLAVQLSLEEPARALIPEGWRFARLATQTVPALLQTLFVGFALYWTVADWRVDLVESRRRTRALTLVIIGMATIAASLLTRVVIAPDSEANYLAHVAVDGADLAILAFVLVRLMGGDLREEIGFGPGRTASPARRAVAEGAPEREQQAALGRLTVLLEDEQICQEPGLSLPGLARRVGLPVYRLRRLIHERLGYQNFNALLHDYRVKAACRQLSDPALRRTPILTIALSVGYSSVNTFNRGFLDIMRVTPSAYRSLALSGDTPESE
jgi:AraC-like DNA-binding protein